MKKEKTVKTHQRRTKSGKVIVVKEHKAKYDAAEELKKAMSKAVGAGGELEALKNKKPVAQEEDEKSPYDEYGFTKDEFKEWYEGTGSKADKKVEKALRKALGRKAYTELNDQAADSYKKGGADKFFTKGLEEMKASTRAATKSVTPFKETKGSAKSTEIPSSAVKVKTSEGDLYVSGTTLRTAKIYKETPSGIEKLHPKRGFSEKDAKKIEKALSDGASKSSKSASKESMGDFKGHPKVMAKIDKLVQSYQKDIEKAQKHIDAGDVRPGGTGSRRMSYKEQKKYAEKRKSRRDKESK